MQKLEILTQIKMKFGNQINPQLVEMKYCQTIKNAHIEMYFQNISTPLTIDLAFIGGEIVKDDKGNDADILQMFNPDADIIDNAKSFLGLDNYSLMMCIDNLYTEEAANSINEKYLMTLKNK